MKAFSRSLKEESAETGIPLYVLSAILDIIICYLAYSKFSDFTADQFYDWVNKGEYLLIPLMLLLIGVASIAFILASVLSCRMIGRNDQFYHLADILVIIVGSFH